MFFKKICCSFMLLGFGTVLAATTNYNRFIYSTLRPYNWNIYMYNMKDKKITRLTNSKFLDYDPVLRPDGNFVVFTSERNDVPNLYSLNLKTKVITKLTTSDQFEDQASFSPDGNYLYYTASYNGVADIYKIKFLPNQTISYQQGINLTKGIGSNFHPSVSPNGKIIAFSSNRYKTASIIEGPRPPENYKASNLYIMDNNGQNIKNITNNSYWNGSPTWSNNGKIIYYYVTEKSSPQIRAINLDDMRDKTLTGADMEALSPAVMGDEVIFSCNKGGRWQLCKLDPKTKIQQIFLTNKIYNLWYPKFDNALKEMVFYGDNKTESSDIFEIKSPTVYKSDAFHFTNAKQQVQKPMGIGPFIAFHGEKRISKTIFDTLAVRGYFPIISPDGKKIASTEGFNEIVISNINGTDKQVVFKPFGDTAVFGLTWSHDGKYLATSIGHTFAKNNNSVNIWLFRSDGRNSINLTNNNYNNALPQFTPDDKHIIFRSSRDGIKSLYIMDINGKNVKRLTSGSMIDTMPCISQDGRQIVFSSLRDKINYHLYILNLGNNYSPKNIYQITSGEWSDSHPTFSPDGNWVVFASERGGFNDESPLVPIFNPQSYGEIYALNLKTRKIVRLTNNKWEDSLPSF